MRRLITFALLCVMLASSLFCLASLAQASALEQSDTPSGVEFSELNQLSDKKIGTVLGTTYDYDVWNIVEPDPDFVYYADTSEMLTALKYGRIDACCLDYPVATIALERNEGLGIMPEDAGLDANAVAMPKGSPLTKKVTDIVKKFVEDGTMDELEREWCMSPEDSRALPDADWPTTGDTLVCAVDDATEPMSYRNDNGELMGLEVELAYRIARELNMDLELQTMSFDAIAASLNSNTIDMAIALGCRNARCSRYKRLQRRPCRSPLLHAPFDVYSQRPRTHALAGPWQHARTCSHNRIIWSSLGLLSCHGNPRTFQPVRHHQTQASTAHAHQAAQDPACSALHHRTGHVRGSGRRRAARV